MQIFDAKKRALLLMVYVIAFYAHFFVPILSVDPGALLSPVAGSLAPFMGGSPHPVHYMTLGLIPFISAGLMASVFFMFNPQLQKWLSQRDLTVLVQRGLVYAVAAFMSYALVVDLPQESLLLGRLAPWCEFMLSVASVEWLLRRVQQLGLVQSPVTIFLALNILGGFAYAFAKTEAVALESIFSAITCVACFALYKHSFSSDADMLQFRSGRVVHLPIRARVRSLHAGVMPFVYVSMFGAPLLMHFSSSSQHPAEIIVTSPLLLLCMTVLLFVASWLLIGRGDSFSDLKCSLRCFSVQFDKYQSVDAFAAAIRMRQAFFAASLFAALIIAQGAFVCYAGLAPLSGFIGGSAWLIVAAAFFDLDKGRKGGFYDN